MNSGAAADIKKGFAGQTIKVHEPAYVVHGFPDDFFAQATLDKLCPVLPKAIA
jgi:hypothetical protein